MFDRQPLFPRSSGVLLHPTSLPGPDGIGDLGAAAFRYVDWLQQCGQSLWQILPLGPTSYGDSPYQTLSAFAGNPLLISTDRLLRDELAALFEGGTDAIEVIKWKELYGRLEATTDDCEDVANILEGIVVKNT